MGSCILMVLAILISPFLIISAFISLALIMFVIEIIVGVAVDSIYKVIDRIKHYIKEEEEI